MFKPQVDDVVLYRQAFRLVPATVIARCGDTAEIVYVDETGKERRKWVDVRFLVAREKK